MGFEVRLRAQFGGTPMAIGAQEKQCVRYPARQKTATLQIKLINFGGVNPFLCNYNL